MEPAAFDTLAASRGLEAPAWVGALTGLAARRGAVAGEVLLLFGLLTPLPQAKLLRPSRMEPSP